MLQEATVGIEAGEKGMMFFNNKNCSCCWVENRFLGGQECQWEGSVQAVLVRVGDEGGLKKGGSRVSGLENNVSSRL